MLPGNIEPEGRQHTETVFFGGEGGGCLAKSEKFLLKKETFWKREGGSKFLNFPQNEDVIGQ